MTTKIDVTPENDRQLVLARIIDAPVEAVYRAWTDPEVILKWFTPRPWTTKSAEMDLRVGGATTIVMADEQGNEYPNPGQFLEIIPNRKLVVTDAFVGDWKPSAGEPFMTTTIELSNEGGKTRYVARCQHWTPEAKQKHVEMGFEAGWGQCAEQLEETAKTL